MDAGPLTYREIGARLNRTASAVQERLKDLALTSPNAPEWAPREGALIRKHYGATLFAEIGALLGRTRSAVSIRAQKIGITQSNAASWSRKEDTTLRRLHRAAGQSRRSGRWRGCTGALEPRRSPNGSGGAWRRSSTRCSGWGYRAGHTDCDRPYPVRGASFLRSYIPPFVDRVHSSVFRFRTP